MNEPQPAVEAEATSPSPLTSEWLYEHFLEFAEQVRLKFPIVTDPWPPHERDLPCSDGMPVDSDWHMQQRHILLESLRGHWRSRERGYVTVNMGLYYNIDHDRQTYDMVDPDFFAAVEGEKREHDCWVEWDEGRPDLVIELMSPSTYQRDKVERFYIYQDVLRVPEYIWYDPLTEELAGFRLVDGQYTPIMPDADGVLYSKRLDLHLAVRETLYFRERHRYLRFLAPADATLPTSGTMLATIEEQTEAARQRRLAAEARLQAERLSLSELEAEIARLRALVGESSG